MRWEPTEVTVYRENYDDTPSFEFRYYPELPDEKVERVSTSCTCTGYKLTDRTLTVTVGKYKNAALIDVKTSTGITHTLRINVRENQEALRSRPQLVGAKPTISVLPSVQPTVQQRRKSSKIVLIKRDVSNSIHE